MSPRSNEAGPVERPLVVEGRRRSPPRVRADRGRIAALVPGELENRTRFGLAEGIRSASHGHLEDLEVTEDEARMARIDSMIAEMEATIDEARKTSERMTEFFREMGVESESALRDMVRSERCSPALRAMMEEDLAKLDRELEEAARDLVAESGRGEGPKPSRKLRRRMTRI